MIALHAQNALGFQAISRQPVNVWSFFLYQIVQKEIENIFKVEREILIHTKCHQKIYDTNNKVTALCICLRGVWASFPIIECKNVQFIVHDI